MKKTATTKWAWVVIPFLVFATVVGLLPVEEGLWVNIFLLDIAWLGYTFLGIGLAAIVGYFIAKSGNWKLNFYLLAIACIGVGIYLLVPEYFDANWFV